MATWRPLTGYYSPTISACRHPSPTNHTVQNLPSSRLHLLPQLTASVIKSKKPEVDHVPVTPVVSLR